MIARFCALVHVFTRMSAPSPFILSGPHQPRSAVVVSVPHAGRTYPPELAVAARVPSSTLQRLEDRYADLLAKGLAAKGYRIITATYARAWIDLNRAEDEWDSSLIVGGRPPPHVGRYTRAGLGIIPRRLHGVGELWRRRFSHDELLARVEAVHRPYHGAVASALGEAVTAFGSAVLIDLHSMPRQPGGDPELVLGDRHGLTATPQLADRLMAVAEGQGFQVARNAPYAGAHTIERHASRARRIEAVQLEVDRSLYLDAAMEPCPVALRRMAGVVERIVAAADAYATGDQPFILAAE
ncbi:MAG: N-formylglutamate amidohydrolase [Sphingopyxis sp.]